MVQKLAARRTITTGRSASSSRCSVALISRHGDRQSVG
jgi:hypothetical protein